MRQGAFEVVEHRHQLAHDLLAGGALELVALTLGALAEVVELGELAKIHLPETLDLVPAFDRMEAGAAAHGLDGSIAGELLASEAEFRTALSTAGAAEDR